MIIECFLEKKVYITLSKIFDNSRLIHAIFSCAYMLQDKIMSKYE